MQLQGFLLRTYKHIIRLAEDKSMCQFKIASLSVMAEEQNKLFFQQ